MKDLSNTKTELTALEAFSRSRLPVFLTATGLTTGVVAMSALMGYLLDKLFDTWPIFFVIFLVLSFPLTQWTLYRKMRNLAEEAKRSYKNLQSVTK